MPDGSTESRPSVSLLRPNDALSANTSRRNQKIIKPQFFESFRHERDNATLLDSSAAYIAKKSIADSNHLNEHEAAGAPWGGSLPKSVLAREMLPMMTKMQGLTDSRCAVRSQDKLILWQSRYCRYLLKRLSCRRGGQVGTDYTKMC